MFPIIAILLFVMLIALLGIFIYAKKKGIANRPTDYYVFFTMGISWVGIGIILWITTNNFTFLPIGILFMIIGLVHKKEWKKNHRTWKQLTPEEKKFKKMIIIILLVLLILGLAIFAYTNSLLV